MFGLIPLWARIAIIAGAAAALFVTGYSRGASHERAKWEAAQAKEQAGIAAEIIEAGRRAASSARNIADLLSIARQYASANEVRTRYVVKEVTRVVDATPSLAVPLPDRLRELRDEQAAQSAAIADRARRSAGERPSAVPTADR